MRRIVAVLLAAALPGTAAAQNASSPGRFELAAGVGIAAEQSLGTVRATFLTNQAPVGVSFTLFEARSRVRRAPMFTARFGWRLGSRAVLEARGTIARPEIETVITSDPEGANTTFTAERISRYVVDGSLAFHLFGRGFGDRVMPYVLGGGGYLRELHADRALVETGSTVHAGGGLKWLFTDAFGVRFEGRATNRSGGIDLGQDRRRTSGSFDAALLFVF